MSIYRQTDSREYRSEIQLQLVVLVGNKYPGYLLRALGVWIGVAGVKEETGRQDSAEKVR